MISVPFAVRERNHFVCHTPFLRGNSRGVSVRLLVKHFSHGQLHLSREDSRRQHSSRSVGSSVPRHWIVNEIDDPAATVIDSFVPSEDSTFPFFSSRPSCCLHGIFSSSSLLFVKHGSERTLRGDWCEQACLRGELGLRSGQTSARESGLCVQVGEVCVYAELGLRSGQTSARENGLSVQVVGEVCLRRAGAP